MPAYSAEQSAQIARVLRVKQAHEDALLGLPGVNAVGLSLKKVNGVRVPRFAMIVHVTEKKPLDELPPEERIPPEIDGVATDVVVGGPFRAMDAVTDDSNYDLRRYRPVRGGSAITPDGRDPAGDQAHGTLGCVVVNTDPGITNPGKQFLILTCSHVLFEPPSVAHTGKKVGQPDTCSFCSPCMDHVIAHMDRDGVLSGYPPASPPTSDPGADAGVATLCRYCRAVTLFEPATTWIPAVIKIADDGSSTTEPIAGTYPMDDPGVLFDKDQQHIYEVHKHGIATGDTQGWVDDIHFTLEKQWGDPANPVTLRFKDQIMIVPKDEGAIFCAEGDSGAVVLNSESKVVGLLSSASTQGLVGAGAAAPIAAVESQLKVHVADAATYPGTQTVPELAAGSAGTAEAAAVPAGSAVVMAQRFAEAESALRATPAGDFLAETIRRHVPEVRRLVNTNRRVLVVWRRMEGPRWLGQGMQWLVSRVQAFPAAAGDLRFADCVEAFAEVLREHGSRDLARDAAWLADLLPRFAGKSYDDALALLRLQGDSAGPDRVTLVSRG
jgi:hypothetical protein